MYVKEEFLKQSPADSKQVNPVAIIPYEEYVRLKKLDNEIKKMNISVSDLRKIAENVTSIINTIEKVMS